ncbi:M42 family metallopeptidase [Oceanotoga sp. DSM 15011]|uniref:M42 family metallopeptidase n=1 Tax=Oceanotoga sp. DSM 15011 TaxID=2984951 RepID=UPI0021F4BE71|nr:M42 family metallopeptidase [Oceanotoga sp. DSM 15011]UYP00298.1 M42 family metallopeptidase [Oceanotoga sp. DSM 15011]
MKELIKNITEIYSPSGREDKVREFIINEIKDYVDDIKIDKLGNLIAIKKGQSDKTILFDGHMDEIGLVVTHITETGFLKVDAVGGVNPTILLGTRLQFNGVTGVAGVEGETLKELRENNTSLSMDSIFIDIGASNREEAQKIAPIGTFGTYDANFVDLGNRLISKAMDDRIACSIMIQAIKGIKDNKNNIIFAFTVQEEVGLVGASVAGYDYDIDMAIAIDVTMAGDTPKGLKRISMELDRGPCIKVKDSASISDREVVDFIKETAIEEKIPYQMEVLLFGGTNAAGYQKTKAGIPVSTISIATRYIHTPHEVVSYEDVENTVKLILAMSKKDI